MEIGSTILSEDLLHEVGANRIRQQCANSENHYVEQTLRACPSILGEVGIHKDINGRKEVRVTNAMENLHQNDEFLVLWEEGVNRKARRVSEDADDHRGPPTQLLQGDAQDEHRENFRHLANAHDGHDPVAGNANAARFFRGAKEGAGPVEIAVMDE